ncbi:protein unc-93 homolog A-like [Limulus polyphemus]|uniref:Protein unc-93 homolog A-like n=1 Tax=Limulus polyphemus TaxID=6850 RepID=A0ABM1C657_LIMPO|nr:protein unc-93 homolog A-like [Limulus polyphemus]
MADMNQVNNGSENTSYIMDESDVRGKPQNHDAPRENTHTEQFSIPMTKRRIIKNLIVISFGFLFLFTTFQALANLQSTLNSEDGIGVASQSIIYGALIVSSLFLPAIVIKKLGCKRTMVLAMLCYTPYIAANFYPHWGTLIPSALILGLGAAPLWSAKCTYLNEIGFRYTEMVNETEDTIIVRFFGIFFMFFQSTQIWGNLISYFVLRPENEIMYLVNDSDASLSFCGSNFCNQVQSPNLVRPEDTKVYMLIGIYLASAIFGAILLELFLDPLKREFVEFDKKLTGVRLLLATLKHLKNPCQIVIIPLTIYSGLEQAFFLSEYTKAYIACSWGIHRIGFVLICFGVVNAVVSLLSGPLVKLVSRLPIFITAALANLGITITFLYWEPNSSQTAVLLALAGIWGFSDAVWQTQINAFYGIIFKKNEEAAFSNYRLWESIGFSMAFAYSNYLCVDVKIYILIGFLVLGIIGYLAIEFFKKRHSKGMFWLYLD